MTGRVRLVDYIVAQNGDAVSSGSWEARHKVDNTLADVYTTETGATTAANPYTAGDGTPNAVGLVDVWIPPGEYVITVGTTPTATEYTVFIPHKEHKAVLFLGQSNMRTNSGSTGGNMSIHPHVYWWDGDETQAGTAFYTPSDGVYPFDKTPDAGVTYANSMPYATCRRLADVLGGNIYGIMYAEGEHEATAWVTPAGRTANSWTLDGSDTDKTQYMYPGIANALAAIPNGRTYVDAVYIHQGETASPGGWAEWRAKWGVVLEELIAAGVVDRDETVIVFGQMCDSGAHVDDMIPQHEAAIEVGLNITGPASGYSTTAFPYFGFVDATKVPIADNNHFTGAGLVFMGERAAAQILNPTGYEYYRILEETPTITLSDAASGGNLASVTTTRGLTLSKRYIVRDGSKGNRPLGVGGETTSRVQFVTIDTTGMTGANDIHIQGACPFPSRSGQASLSIGMCEGKNIDFANSMLAEVPVNGSSVIKIRDNVSFSASPSVTDWITVAAISSTDSYLYVDVTYSTEIGTYG